MTLTEPSVSPVSGRLTGFFYNILYNFYAVSEVDEASLHKVRTKSVEFFAVWALETKVPKNISCCIYQLV